MSTSNDTNNIDAACIVWVTRPQAVGISWMEGLREAGFDARSMPLLALTGEVDQSPAKEAWARLDDYASVIFVSISAVEYFFQARPKAISLMILAAGTRWWAPGESTRKALFTQGVPASQLDIPDLKLGRFDSEALWSQVQHQVRVGHKYLLVRGAAADGRSQGREYLTQALMQRGARVDVLSVYRRCPLAPATPLRSGVWLFSSVLSLQALKKGEWEEAIALCTHARIAVVAKTFGFARVLLVQPQLAKIVDTLRSLKYG